MDGLSAGQFSLSIDGTPQRLCAVVHTRVPLSMGILLDVSGSMRGMQHDLIGIAKAAIASLLETSGPEDEYFLDYVDEKPAVSGRFTSNPAVIRSRLDATRKGRSAIMEALRQGVVAMKNAHHPNRALLLVSDGMDNLSEDRFKALAAEFAQSPVPIFLAAPSEAGTQNFGANEIASREQLVKFVSKTGGYPVLARSTHEMSAAMAEIGSVARSPYQLIFPRPQSPGRPLHPRVEIIGVKPRPLILHPGI